MAKANHIIGINCEGAAADAIGPILIARFEEMCAFRDRALDWNDPEGVHDMRVSSRRLRGALRDFMPYLKKRHLWSVLKQLNHLADALGAVRDQDVAIMGLQKLATSAPFEAAAMVDELIRARETIRKQARKNLQQLLLKYQLAELRRNFVTGISSAMVNSRRSKNTESESEVTYREVARCIVIKRLKELETLSEGLYQPLRIKPLHTMRIAAKRLRYALELFEPCWGSEISVLLKEIVALQASLGELHDSDIWIQTFGEHLNGVKKQRKDRAGGALWLLSHFVGLHSKHLRNTLDRWSNWEAKGFGLRLRESLQLESGRGSAEEEHG